MKKVLCLGDSITANGGFVKRLRELTNGSVEFHIAATVGHSTGQMLKRISDASQEGYADLSSYDAIIVLGGVNNIWAGADRIISDLSSITRIALSKMKKPARVIALTLLPYKGYSTWKASYHEQILKVNARLKKGETGAHSCVDIFPVLADPADPQALRSNLTSDRLHPNSQGQILIGDWIYKSIFK